MKKEHKLIIFIVGLVLVLIVLGFICFSFNNYLKGYYRDLANDYINNPQYYLAGGVSQQTIDERVQTYTRLANQSLNGEEPVVFMFGIMFYVFVYCFIIANIEEAKAKVEVKKIKEEIKT